MATKVIASSGGDFSDWSTYIAYLRNLNTLTETEICHISGEVDGGYPEFAGTSCIPTSAFPFIIEAAPGGKFSGNPLRYGDGARVLLDGNSEIFVIAWRYTTLQNIAIKKTGTAQSGGYLGALSIASIYEMTVKNVVVESSASSLAVVDDQGAVTEAIRENILGLRISGGNCGSWPAYYLRTGSPQYPVIRNCAIIGVGPAITAGTAFSQTTGSSVTFYNCISYGHPTDWSSGEQGSHNATWLTSTSSNMPTSAAVYALSADNFESVSAPSHDLRVRSTSNQLLDLGSSAQGTTTDILGNSVSGSSRDIGVHEYQSGGGGGSNGTPLLYAIRRRRSFYHTLRMSG